VGRAFKILLKQRKRERSGAKDWQPVLLPDLQGGPECDKRPAAVKGFGYFAPSK